MSKRETESGRGSESESATGIEKEIDRCLLMKMVSVSDWEVLGNQYNFFLKHQLKEKEGEKQTCDLRF